MRWPGLPSNIQPANPGLTSGDNVQLSKARIPRDEEREVTKVRPPSVPEFMKPAKKHQMRIETVRAQLDFISEASCRAYEVLKKLAREKLPKPLPTTRWTFRFSWEGARA